MVLERPPNRALDFARVYFSAQGNPLISFRIGLNIVLDYMARALLPVLCLIMKEAGTDRSVCATPLKITIAQNCGHRHDALVFVICQRNKHVDGPRLALCYVNLSP